MDKKLKFALIGAGGICRHAHVPGYLNMDNVEIVAVCDIIEERAKEVAEMVGAKITCTDYKDILKIEGLDAVDICTPNYMHSVIAVDALNAGINVFCEKPDAVSVEEATKMKAASESSGKTLMVMRNNRYRGISNYLKQYIADGKMGDIYAARCGWQRRRGIPGKGGWFTTKAQSGGGPLIDLGVHMIDLSIWLMGNPKPVAVSGCTYEKFANSNVSDSAHSKFGTVQDGGTFDVEDLAMGFIRFDNGACMQIEFSWASNIEREKIFMEFRGTKSGAEWNDIDNQLKIFTEEYGSTVDILPNVKDKYQIHEANLRHFADVLTGNAEPMFVPEQGVDMIKILEGFYKSAELGHEIQL
ncbi:MAG: Gfo/Idh/MocA family oxidoreductase [Clostridia bacterium]|nr:Gfo/Idh/MocA family oxidoreductase [Clostridia bacterium]